MPILPALRKLRESTFKVWEAAWAAQYIAAHTVWLPDASLKQTNKNFRLRRHEYYDCVCAKHGCVIVKWAGVTGGR